MRFMGRSSLAVALGFAGMLALAATGAAEAHQSHRGEQHLCHGDGGSGIFTSLDFSGIYVASFQGNSGATPGVWSTGNGLLTATPTDGADGTITGSLTITDNGNAGAGDFCPGTVTGTYTVAGDGTGGLTLTFTPNTSAPLPSGSCTPYSTNPLTEAIVIGSDHHVSFVQTNGGMPALGTLVRQSEPNGGF